MTIELKEVTVRELVEGYSDNEENGVVGYSGRLNIRPKYQREFVYKDKQRDAVVNTVMNDFPLNVMYWAVCADGTYEVIDGQQRTISICQYVTGVFAYMFRFFHNLQPDEQKRILDYKLMVYVCSGKDSEKLEWFKTINIAGEELTNQELRNAVYAGAWLSDAKRYFSRNNCPAHAIACDYLVGKANRQEYLETAISWISGGNIEVYMSNHQHDSNATALWLYFQSVITWVSATFKIKRPKFMRGVDWGSLYEKFKGSVLDTDAIELETKRLILDDDVTNKKGIYPYVLTRNEKYLSIRAFSDAMKQAVYERQAGICVKCNEFFAIEHMEADHITPWSQGGKTLVENCQMLCISCNRKKSDK